MTAEQRVKATVRVIGLAFLGVLLIGCLGGLVEAPLLLAWHLGTGWFRHPLVNFPHLGWNPVTIALALLGFLAVTGILHRFLRRTGPGRPFSLSLRITTLALVMSAAAIAMTGIVHQLGWLGRTKIITSNHNSAHIRALIDSRQLYLALFDLNHDGVFPASLAEIRQHHPTFPETMLSHPVDSHGRGTEPYRYLVPGKDILSLPPGTPIVAALGINGDRVVYVRADGEVVSTDLEGFGRLMEEREP